MRELLFALAVAGLVVYGAYAMNTMAGSPAIFGLRPIVGLGYLAGAGAFLKQLRLL